MNKMIKIWSVFKDIIMISQEKKLTIANYHNHEVMRDYCLFTLRGTKK